MSKLLDLFNSGVNKSVKNETNFSLEIYYRDNYNILNTPNIINLNEIYNKNITENRSFYIDDKIPEQNNLVKIYNQNFSLSNGISDIGGLLTGNITLSTFADKSIGSLTNVGGFTKTLTTAFTNNPTISSQINSLTNDSYNGIKEGLIINQLVPSDYLTFLYSPYPELRISSDYKDTIIKNSLKTSFDNVVRNLPGDLLSGRNPSKTLLKLSSGLVEDSLNGLSIIQMAQEGLKYTERSAIFDITKPTWDNYFNVDLFNTKPINTNFVTLYKNGVIGSIDKGSLLTFNKYSGFTSTGTNNDPSARIYSNSYEQHTTMLVRYDMLNSMQYNNDTQILYGDSLFNFGNLATHHLAYNEMKIQNYTPNISLIKLPSDQLINQDNKIKFSFDDVSKQDYKSDYDIKIQKSNIVGLFDNLQYYNRFNKNTSGSKKYEEVIQNELVKKTLYNSYGFSYDRPRDPLQSHIFFNDDYLDKFNILDVGEDYANMQANTEYSASADLIYNGEEIKDLIDFKFVHINSNQNKKEIPIVFRAAINNIDDSVNANWSDVTYVGRGDKSYTYDGHGRSISLDFTVYVTNPKELIPQWRKINYMYGLCYPSYYLQGKTMVAPIVKLTIGNILNNIHVKFNSVNLKINDNSMWEIQPGLQLPHIVTLSIQMDVLLEENNKLAITNTKHFNSNYITKNNFDLPNYLNQEVKFKNSVING